LVKRFENVGVAAFIVTDIERDGTLGGPDVSGLSAIVAATSVDVVASGGVGSLEDLQTLAEVSIDGKRIAGVITGKAIYEEKFTVAQALSVLGETGEA
jgi:phosphoribosylformimino-5-aminoimidazole carboxamide ribonucleotide (ProFAR) isomerase